MSDICFIAITLSDVLYYFLQRREHPYLGAFFLHMNCFTNVACPFSYHQLNNLSMVEAWELINQYISEHAGK